MFWKFLKYCKINVNSDGYELKDQTLHEYFEKAFYLSWIAYKNKMVAVGSG